MAACAPVVAGIGRGICDAIRLARVSAEAGAAVLMVHQPLDAFVAPRGLKDDVSALSGAGGGLPIMLYLRKDALGARNKLAWLKTLHLVKTLVSRSS